MNELFSGIDLPIYNLSQIVRNSSNDALSLSCLSYLANPSHYTDFTKYFKNSGRGVNQLGDYPQCVSLSNTTYNLGFISLNKSQTPLYLGVCFNKACSSNDIQQILRLTKSPINFWAVTTPQNQHFTLSTSSMFVCLVLFMILLSCLFATLYFYLKKQKNPCSKTEQIIFNFSLQKTLTIFNRPGEIKFLNGIRTISFFLVALGHQIGIRNVAMSNILKIGTQFTKFYMTLTLAYTFSVDVFYYIGGFMVGFLFLKTYYRKPRFVFFPLAIVQRILRFWPVFILTIFCYTSLLPVLGDGPLYKSFLIIRHYVFDCSANWWSDLLFIGNFRQNICLGWGWYILVDMQLFVLSLILLLGYVIPERKRYFYILKLLIMIGSMVIVFLQCQKYKFHTEGALSDLTDPNYDYYTLHLYIKPWSRTYVYLLGVAIGIFYFEYDKDHKKIDYKKPHLLKFIQNKYVRICGMLIGIAIILFIMIIPRTLTFGSIWPQVYHSLYLTFARFLFIVGLILITFPFFFGYTNFFKVFLECEMLQHISKISFSCYMIHFMVIQRNGFIVQKSQYLSPIKIVMNWASDMPIILLLGLLVTLFYQMPIAFCIDMLFGKTKGKPLQRKIQEEIKIHSISQTTKLTNPSES